MENSIDSEYLSRYAETPPVREEGGAWGPTSCRLGEEEQTAVEAGYAGEPEQVGEESGTKPASEGQGPQRHGDTAEEDAEHDVLPFGIRQVTESGQQNACEQAVAADQEAQGRKAPVDLLAFVVRGHNIFS